MRKVTTTLIVACIFLMFSVTAYAEPSITITENGQSVPDSAITVTDMDAEDAESPALPVREVTATHQHQPIDIETVTEDGVTIVKKTFEATPGLDPQTLAQPFEQDGYSFIAREIQRREAPGETLTRQASKTTTIESDTNDIAVAAQLFPHTISYEQDGYTGILHLDLTSLEIEAGDYETYTHPFTRTREVPGLARNDPALIEREWDGMALYSVSFRQGTDGRFTATAVYRGTTTGRRPVSFTATVNHYGEVTRAMPGYILYTVIFEGSPAPASQLPILPRPRPPATVTEAARESSLLPIILGAVVLIVAAFALLRIIRKLGRKGTLNPLKLRKERVNSHEAIVETKRCIRED